MEIKTSNEIHRIIAKCDFEDIEKENKKWLAVDYEYNKLKEIHTFSLTNPKEAWEQLEWYLEELKEVKNDKK